MDELIHRDAYLVGDGGKGSMLKDDELMPFEDEEVEEDNR
jgi:hypothetical protein